MYKDSNSKEGKKCYIYSRVSTNMQVDGYSLDAQVERMKRYADYENMIIAGSYCDEGKSGKSINGRIEFQRMLEDIENKKDNVSFVLVFKLSRFGRNAADVLSSLKRMQRYGVNLICVEESIDSSKDSGKLMISVLSAVAEIERENILIQTMEGRREKARKGLWNGGVAPYGYSLEKGVLVVADDEKEIVQSVFKSYAYTAKGINAIVRDLNQRGIKKKKRCTNNIEEFTTSFVGNLLNNPVYIGKIAYGRRTTELVEGKDDQYMKVRTDDYILADGMHEALIDDVTWKAVQKRRKDNAGRCEQKYNFGKRHLLSSILKCPECGANMYSNVNRKKKLDGSIYNEYHYYVCKHRRCYGSSNKKCSYKKQWKEEKINHAVEEIIFKLVKNERFANSLKEKIGTEIDTTEIDKVITDYQGQLHKAERNLQNWEDKLNNLDVEDRHYSRKVERYENQITGLYDSIEEIESAIEDARARRRGIQMKAVTSDNIYKYLLYFDKLYVKMTDDEKKAFLESFIEAVHILPEEKGNGQFLRRIDFKFPICYDNEKGDCIFWDSSEHVETVVMLSHKKPDSVINVKVEFGEGEGKVPLDNIAKRAAAYKPKERVTYKMIKEYIEAKYGFKVHTAYIAEVKRELGLPMYDAPNAVEELKQPRKHPTTEKVEAIKDALKHFEVI